jgi:aromatic ring-opening dioxygenase catalytic subunit (LigB family)
MTYDEFSDKLKEIKYEFENSKKMKLDTIKQLETFLIERKSRRFSKGLKSLKGFDL